MRQEVFHQRVDGHQGPWTTDQILQDHRFTNAYRAADRVSQYLIRHVAYAGDPGPEESAFRVLLFKLFNRIPTWELLRAHFGELTWRSFQLEAFDRVLTEAHARGKRIYSAAYIMPAAHRGIARKHRSHLLLLQQMLSEGLPRKLVASTTMKEGYEILLSYPGIGPFLAYQLITDLNYTEILSYSEMEFVMPGPGALSGLRKCFSDFGDYGPDDVIRLVAERQQEEFMSRGLDFRDLWGRPLQLIDCQNLFCEVDKYARLAHPEVAGIGNRTRIKQKFQPMAEPVNVWFPPKWGINAELPGSVRVRPRPRWSEPQGRRGLSRDLPL